MEQQIASTICCSMANPCSAADCGDHLDTITPKTESIIARVLEEVAACVGRVSAVSLTRAEELIEATAPIFVAGAGRSGLVMRALASA